jgi:hypothetical protein
MVDFLTNSSGHPFNCFRFAEYVLRRDSVKSSPATEGTGSMGREIETRQDTGR